ncbi:hypothetical protein J6590_006698 [Homalodisca vitripennis]|nr:hypothetical protein J6590_006698 [Homalodisca vitripennis]
MDSLPFIQQDIIDLASLLYSELHSIRATFGEGSIERLLPYVGAAMTKLYDLAKSNSELAEEVELLRGELASTEHRCTTLKDICKGETAECCDLEEQSDAEICRPGTQLVRFSEKNARLQQRQRRSSPSDILLAELTLAEPNPPEPDSKTPVPPTPQNRSYFRHVLLIGDSHLRHSSMECVSLGAYLECCLEGKISDIKTRLLGYVGLSLSVIYIHVGAYNLRKDYRGGPGYNGGDGKRKVLHEMADLLYTVRTSFPNSKAFLDSVLVRRDISDRALSHFNDQLYLMCNNFGVEFVEANNCVSRRDLTEDGELFTGRALSRLGSLFVANISAALRLHDVEPPVPGGLGGVKSDADQDSGTEKFSDSAHGSDASQTSETDD